MPTDADNQKSAWLLLVLLCLAMLRPQAVIRNVSTANGSVPFVFLGCENEPRNITPEELSLIGQ